MVKTEGLAEDIHPPSVTVLGTTTPLRTQSTNAMFCLSHSDSSHAASDSHRFYLEISLFSVPHGLTPVQVLIQTQTVSLGLVLTADLISF